MSRDSHSDRNYGSTVLLVGLGMVLIAVLAGGLLWLSRQRRAAKARTRLVSGPAPGPREVLPAEAAEAS